MPGCLNPGKLRIRRLYNSPRFFAFANDTHQCTGHMEDLKKMMLFRGQQDYEQSCTEMIEGLKKMISLTAETTGWIELPEGGRIRAGAMA